MAAVSAEDRAIVQAASTRGLPTAVVTHGWSGPVMPVTIAGVGVNTLYMAGTPRDVTTLPAAGAFVMPSDESQGMILRRVTSHVVATPVVAHAIAYALYAFWELWLLPVSAAVPAAPTGLPAAGATKIAQGAFGADLFVRTAIEPGYKVLACSVWPDTSGAAADVWYGVGFVNAMFERVTER